MATFTIDLLTGDQYLFNTGISGNTGSTGVVVFTNPNPTPNTVGGIPAGSSFNNRTMQEMWNALLYPIQYPILTPPNNTFTLTQSGLREIGEIVATLNFSSNFSRGIINPAYGTSGFRSGLPNTYNYTGSGLPVSVTSTSLSNAQTINNYVVGIGVQSWTNTVTYDAGEQPKDSTGANYSSPLAAGTTSSKTVSITGVYPYFGTTVNITTLTQQPLALMNSVYVQLNVVGESGGNKQRVELPIAWSTITGIQFFNTFSSTWEWIGGSKANSLLTFTVTDTIKVVQGNAIQYKLWTHNGSTIGARQLRFYTT